MTEKELKNYKLPTHLRKKDGYWHMIIDAKHPITKEIVRHSKSTKIKAIGKTKKETENNEFEARKQLKEFQKKWSDYYFSGENKEENSQEILFTDYLENWLYSIKANVEPYTFRNYKMIIERKVIPYFINKKLLLKDVRAYHLQEFYSYCLNKENLNPNTVIRYHANIRKALHTAFKQGLVTSNQADLVDKPRKKRYITKTLNQEQLLQIFEETQGTYLALPIFLSMHHGLRRSEALGLLWSNINLEEGTMIINNTLLEDDTRTLFNVKKTKNNTSGRTLPLIPEVVEFLKNVKKQQEENKKIFKNSYNKKFIDNVCVKENGDIITPSYVSQKFTNITRKLGYEDIHFHCLRHSYATLLFKEGLNLKIISMLLGHSCYNTTSETYLHLTEPFLLNLGRQSMEKIFGNKKIIYINSNQPASEIIK